MFGIEIEIVVYCGEDDYWEVEFVVMYEMVFVCDCYCGVSWG